MVAWYKHDIPAWMDGTEALDDGPYRAYHVICQLIYLNEGPIALNEHGIAGRCRQHILAFRRHLKSLLDGGKLVLIDGRLSNNRAATELQLVHDHRITSGKGGRNSRGIKKRSEADHEDNSLKDNESDHSPLLLGQHQETRLEKTREEKKETRERALPDDWPKDYQEQFWSAFPNKVGKPVALKKLCQVAYGGKVRWRDLFCGLQNYVGSKPVDRPWLNPATFLNQSRWEDQPAPALKLVDCGLGIMKPAGSSPSNKYGRPGW